MDRNKALDKVKKCLALSKSPNANEAAAALRQAVALMRKHGIEEHEVSELINEHVDVPIQKNKKMPAQLSMLVNIIVKSFNVKPVVESRVGVSDESYRIRYFGPYDRVKLAAYAHTVVYRAMEASWRQHLANEPWLRGERGARLSFQLGWLGEVENTVQEFAWEDGELEATNNFMLRHYGKELQVAKVNSNVSVDGTIVSDGARAASGFSIHRPMEKETLRIEAK